ASDQNTLRREAGSVRAHRYSAARAEKAGRLTAVLAGYVPWWRHRTNETASRYEGGNLKPLIEAMPVAVIVVDDDHKVVLANEPAAALFGYTTSELRGLSFVQLCPRMADNSDSEVGSSGIFLPDSRFAAAGARRMAVARARDGSERPVSVQFKQYGTGAAPWIVTIVDFGEQSETSADELNRAQFGRVSELGEMAAALAHEINQPLTAILGNAQAAQRFLASSESDPSNLREALTDIVDDSFRATEIVRKLRQLVRGATPETRPLDIGTLVREATHLMRRTALARGVSVTFDRDKHLPEVRGDKIQLQQVMINLLQNAFDAVETCSVERRLVSVEVRAVPQQSAISIAVSDRGPGLKADQVGDVFKPF